MLLSPTRIVARYQQRVAEDLTRSWLMAVKRGWKAVVEEPIGVPFKAVKLKRFMKNLLETVQFNRQGLGSRWPSERDAKAIEAAFEKALSKIDPVLETFEHLRDEYANAEERKDSLRQDISKWNDGKGIAYLMRELGGFDEFCKEYPDWKRCALDSEQAREALDKHDQDPKTWKAVTTAFEKVMTLLYLDAQLLAEARQDGQEVIDMAIDKVFDLYGMKVVIAAPDITPEDARGYLRAFDKAYALLKAKKFTSVWYGVTFVESRESEKFNRATTEAYARLGYKDMRAAAGSYHDGEDKVVLTLPPEDTVPTLIHEMGHRYWFKKMKPEQRVRFNALVRTNPSEQSRATPSGWLEDGKEGFDLKTLLSDFRDAVEDMGKEVDSRFKDTQMLRPKTLMLSRKFRAVFDDILKQAPEKVRAKGIDITNSLFAMIEGFDLYTDEEVENMKLLDLRRMASDWRKHDAPEAIRQFERAVSDALSEYGTVKPVSPVSDYGQSSIEEAFAVAWEHYVLEKNMNRDQLESFRSVLSCSTNPQLRVFFDSLAGV